MSACKYNPAEIRLNLRNKKAAITPDPTATQEDIAELIDTIDQQFILSKQNVDKNKIGDDGNRYTMYADDGVTLSDFFLSKRVTDAVARFYRRGRTAAEVEAGFNNPNNIRSREYGTHVHKIMQLLLETQYKYYADDSMDKTKMDVDLRSVLDTVADPRFPITPAQHNSLVRGSKILFEKLLETQASIDPNKKLILKAEKLVIDSVDDVGGTIDILAIFSDKSALVVDFKSMSPSYGVKVNKKGVRSLVDEKYVALSTREGWEIQQSTYKRILMKRYNVPVVRGTWVMPIWLDFNTDEKKNKTDLAQIQTIADDNLLRFKMVGVDTTTKSYIDEFLNTQVKEIRRLQQIRTTVPYEERVILDERIRSIQEGLDDFIENRHTFDSFIKDAVRVANKDYKDATIEELQDAITYLDAVIQLEYNYELDPEVDSEENPFDVSDNQVFKEVKKKYSTIKLQFRDMLISRISDRYGNILGPKDKIVLHEDNYISQILNSPTELTNPIVRYAQDLIQQSYNNKRKALREFDTKFAKVEESVEKWLTGKGETLSDLHKYILDIGDKGVKFVARINKAFYDSANEAYEKKDVNFFLTNYRIKPENNGKNYREWFKESLDNYTKKLKEQHKGKKTADEKVKQGVEWFKSQFDLSISSLTGKPNYPSAWLNRRNYWKEIKPEVAVANESERYKFIKNNAPLLEYYTQMKNFVKEFRSVAGYKLIDSSLFFPVVRASVLEKIQRSDLYSLGNDVAKMLSIREDTQTYGHQDTEDDIKFEGEKRIPLFYTNPFRNADGTVNTSEQTLDIGASMRLMASSVYNYKYMEEIEAEVLALKQLESEAEYLKGDFGESIFDRFGNLAKKDKDKTMIQNVMDVMIDNHVYGIKLQTTKDTKLTEIANKVINYNSRAKLAFGFIPGITSYISGQLNSILESTKGQIFTSKQWAESTKLMTKEHKKYHALSYFFGVHSEDVLTDIVNARVGQRKSIIADNLYTSKLNKYINGRLMMRPMSYGDERIDNHVSVAMALNYGVDKETGNIRRLSNLPPNSKSLYELFSVDSDGKIQIDIKEEQLDKVIMQFQQAVRAGQRKIKGSISSEELPYYDNFLVGKLLGQFKKWVPPIVNERFGALKVNDILDTVEQGRYSVIWNENDVNDSANMVYYTLNKLASSLTFIGKNLLTYGTIGRALGADIKLNEQRSMLQYNNLKQKYANMPGMLEKIPTFEDFVEMKKGQIRATLGEVEMYLMLLAATLMLGADWDDDEIPNYKEMWVLHKMYQITNRVKTELSFTYNPLEYAKIFKEPIPAAGLAITTAKALDNFKDEFIDGVTGRVDMKDDTDLFHYSISLLPAIYQVSRTLELRDVDIEATR